MKTLKYFCILAVAFITACVHVDRYDYIPSYQITNQTNEMVSLVYCMQPIIVEKGYREMDTIVISANDTVEILIDKIYGGKYEQLKPSAIFARMTFYSPSDSKLLEMNVINDSDWLLCELPNEKGGWMFARGWLYKYSKE